MESTRPTPVDLSQFQPGQNRDFILEQLGAPQNSAMESDGASCDFYKLYTHGYGAGGKIPIALAEGAADFFTLGLAEIVTTPAEGATKNELHPVAFCYRNNSLIRVVGPGTSMEDNAAAQAPLQPQSAASGSVSQLPSGQPGGQTSAALVSSVPPATQLSSAAAQSPSGSAAPAAAVVPTAVHAIDLPK